MNTLLTDFIVEARDLLESVSTNLLELERDPENGELITLSFRAFHTLKGDSGLFDFRPITDVLHAAENQLSELREGRLALSHDLVDALLAAGDQIGKWLLDIEKTEGLPSDAPLNAERLAKRLESISGHEPEAATSVAPTTSVAADLSCFSDEQRQRAAVLSMRAGDVATYVLFRPDHECFFRGEDPLFTVQQIQPRLVHVEAPAEWGPLAELDPYRCRLGFAVLTTMVREELEYLFRYVPDQVEIVDLLPRDLWPAATAGLDVESLGLTQEERDRVGFWVTGQAPKTANGNVDSAVAEVLREQLRALEVPGDASVLEGRLRSTATVIGRLINLNAIDDVRLQEVVAICLEAQSSSALVDWIESRLGAAEIPPAAAAPPLVEGKDLQSSIKTLKVDQSRIDRIMSLIGEMVVAKNSLPYLSERAERTFGVRELSREIRDQYAVINRITQEMQDAIMEVRMLPVAHVLQRFPRLVRDLSRKLGKKIEMVTEGEDTEADKTMIEALGDPLLHIIRNSLDHGIESPEDRVRAGKQETGVIRVIASQENGQVLILITDDGRGIDPKKVKDKALSQGILDVERYESMTDREAIQLVFHAGFSTADTITDVSGRGVGMDVVRSAIEKVGGAVQIHSELGKGATVEISLPMTMATSQVMVVEVAGQLLGVPVQIVLETVRVPTPAIFRFKDRELIVLRNQTIPLARLSGLLNLPQAEVAVEETSVLVIRHLGESVGIIVDDFHNNVEVILRPVEGILAGLKGFSSSALLGNGSVLLILDLQELL